MRKEHSSGKPEWVDPDDAPELTEAFFDAATVRDGDRVIKLGRPRQAIYKRQVTLRLDADILDSFRREGPGWQSRINAALREALMVRKDCCVRYLEDDVTRLRIVQAFSCSLLVG